MIRRAIAGLPVYLGLFSAIAVFVLFAGSIKTPYWFYMPTVNIGKVAVPIISCLTIILAIRQALKRNTKSLILAVVSVILVVFTNVVFWGIVLLNFLLMGQYVFRGDVQFNGNRYFVDSAWKPGIGSTYPSSFYLHQCDLDGMNCEVIHQEDYRHIPLDEYRTLSVNFVLDSISNTLTLEINDESVYTIQP